MYKINFSHLIPKKIPVSYRVMLGMLVFIAVLYIPVFSNFLTNWDDDLYILENPYLKTLSLENLKNIFNAYYAGNYHPLTLVSLAIDYKLGGIRPWPYHLTNLLLHLCNTMLVFVFVKSLLQKFSSSSTNYTVLALIAAGLFGIHTYQVESVAWISERKNVLYTFFFLLSLIIYITYITNKSNRTYILCIGLFILSLLSKGMAVPLSLCIMAIDFFAGRKLLSRKVLLEKVPFIVLSLIFGYIALGAQHSVDAIRVIRNFTWIDRVAIATYGFVQYIIKLCFPYHLSAFYPYPASTGTTLPYLFYVSIGITILLLFMLWRFFKQNKIVLFGVLFFIANISIVIQLLPVGDSIMSDRYVYVPCIGFFIIVGYFCTVLWQKNRAYGTGMITVLVLYVTLLSVKTYQRIGVWKDSKTLWGDAIKNYSVNNDRAYLSLGIMSYREGHYPEALGYYKQVLQMHFKNGKSYSQAYMNMGLVKKSMNDTKGAMKDYNTSLSQYPSSEGYYNRALLKIEAGNAESALTDLDKALQIDPFDIGANINKGTILFNKGNYKGALQSFEKVLKVDPQNGHAYLGRGQIKQAMKDVQGALCDYNASLTFLETYMGFINRAVLRIALKDFKGALNDLNKASLIDSASVETYINKGFVYHQTGNYKEALQSYNHALELDPKNSKIYSGRGQTKQALNDIPGAMEDFNIALSLNQTYDWYLNRASLKYSTKDIEGALKDLDKASQVDPKGYEAYFDKGFINLKAGKMLNAIKELNKAIGINTQDFEAYLNRAIAKYKLADYHGAMDDLDLSIELNATKTGYYYRGISKIKLGMRAEACEDLKQAAAMGYTDSEGEIQLNCN